jgi:hypothetical protein
MKIATYDPTRNRSVLRAPMRDAKIVRTNFAMGDGAPTVGILLEETDTRRHSLHLTAEEAASLRQELDRQLSHLASKGAVIRAVLAG